MIAGPSRDESITLPIVKVAETLMLKQRIIKYETGNATGTHNIMHGMVDGHSLRGCETGRRLLLSSSRRLRGWKIGVDHRYSSCTTDYQT